jgi:hypothetical protein
MSKIIAKIRKSGKASLALLMLLCTAVAVGMFLAFAHGSDTDSDQMSDDYESFFSVNYTNLAGSALSYTNAADDKQY